MVIRFRKQTYLKTLMEDEELGKSFLANNSMEDFNARKYNHIINKLSTACLKFKLLLYLPITCNKSEIFLHIEELEKELDVFESSLMYLILNSNISNMPKKYYGYKKEFITELLERKKAEVNNEVGLYTYNDMSGEAFEWINYKRFALPYIPSRILFMQEVNSDYYSYEKTKTKKR